MGAAALLAIGILGGALAGRQRGEDAEAPAIAAAVYDATGVWMDEIPLTPDKVVAALRAHGVGVLE